MAFTNILPRTTPHDLTGADLTGVDETANRTYTLSDDSSNILDDGFDIIVQGTPLHQGVGLDFTRSGNVITFLNIIYNDMVIRINYYISLGVVPSGVLTTGQLRYSNPSLLAEIIFIKGDVPSWGVGGTPAKEEVGIGDNIETIFYLDQKSVLSDTYTIYYGVDETTTTVLVETTHYTIDKDKGKITLTSTGKTLVDTNKIFAEYCYINNGMKTSYLERVLGRAEREVENNTNAIFTNGSQQNPDYPLNEEEQYSEGYFLDRILTDKKPIKDIASELNTDITDSDVSITIKSNDGDKFPISGYLIINSEVITYTGITNDTFTGCNRGVLGTTASAHSEDDEVHTTILFRSDTQEGNEVIWTIQRWNLDFYADNDGLVYRYEGASPSPLTKQDIAKRIKMIYYYGYDEIKEDVTRLTLIYAKRTLKQDNISKSLIAGRNEFLPEMFDADLKEEQSILNTYIVLPMLNT